MSDTKDDRHQVRTTTEETRLLDSLREQKGFTSRSATIRYCIQQTLENEADAIGSRRHFSRTMNARLDQLTENVNMVGETSYIMLTELFAALLKLLDEDAPEELTDPQSMRIDLAETIVKNTLPTEQIYRNLQRSRQQQKQKKTQAKRKQRRQRKRSQAQAAALPDGDTPPAGE
jgi:Arc/MetJ-type ribon-helix-helix transcriptional regulator